MYAYGSGFLTFFHYNILLLRATRKMPPGGKVHFIFYRDDSCLRTSFKRRSILDIFTGTTHVNVKFFLLHC